MNRVCKWSSPGAGTDCRSLLLIEGSNSTHIGLSLREILVIDPSTEGKSWEVSHVPVIQRTLIHDQYLIDHKIAKLAGNDPHTDLADLDAPYHDTLRQKLAPSELVTFYGEITSSHNSELVSAYQRLFSVLPVSAFAAHDYNVDFDGLCHLIGPMAFDDGFAFAGLERGDIPMPTQLEECYGLDSSDGETLAQQMEIAEEDYLASSDNQIIDEVMDRLASSLDLDGPVSIGTHDNCRGVYLSSGDNDASTLCFDFGAGRFKISTPSQFEAEILMNSIDRNLDLPSPAIGIEP